MTGWGRARLAAAPQLSKVEVFPPTCRVAMLRVAATSFTSDSHCLERLRGWVTSRLAETVHEPILDGVLVATNELAANALRHTASGLAGGSFTVTITWDTTAVRVAVGDQGGDNVPEQQAPGLDAESGRGLLITAGLASRWNWRTTAFGCEVVCEFDHTTITGNGDDPASKEP